jgi:hypothetical protein
MRDQEVRWSLSQALRRWHSPRSSLFVDELGLGGVVRVDIAVVNGALWGYEIKSARDTLRRLPKQVEVYSQVMDYASLVVAEQHHKHALELLPPWWGVIVATGPSAKLKLNKTRKAARNEHVDPWVLVQLLWREEALNELARRGLDHGVRTKPRRAIWERLAEELELAELRGAVRATLKSRNGWRSGPLRK